MGGMTLSWIISIVKCLPTDHDNIRFTISEEARLEILSRLAELNKQRYDEEVDLGSTQQQK